MKKCAIISLYGNENYGNKLQNYAVCEIVKKYKIIPEVIRYEHYEIDINYHKDYTKIFRFKYVLKKIKKYLKNRKYKIQQEKRLRSFLQFNKLINYSEFVIKDKERLKMMNQKYDYFLFGSDQIWNIGAFRFYDLAFGTYFDKDKNFSLSASFGIEKIPDEYRKKYVQGISNMKNISVREAAGKKIVEDLINRKDVSVLVDPTMLIKKEEWIKISKKPENMFNEKYILNYFLGELTRKEKNNIVDFANKNNMKIINILDEKDPFYKCGPAEFIYLEKNASLIFTDSFHSCVFGILMETPFIVFERKDENTSINSRLDTLLEKFKLQKRRYKGIIDEKMLQCDYGKTESIIQLERKKMYNYLKEIFKDKLENES